MKSDNSRRRFLRNAVIAVGAVVTIVAIGTPLARKARRQASPQTGVRQVTAARLVTEVSVAELVRPMPLFVQAHEACTHREYLKAAGLLAELQATSGLSAQEIHYVAEQRDIVLNDAGMNTAPVPAPPVLTPKLPADCGPRALRIACESLGVKTTLEMLTKAAGTDTVRGTSFSGLAAAAKAVGVNAEGCLLSRAAFREMSTPAIVRVNAHFVVVTGMAGSGEDSQATYVDPNRPTEKQRVDTEKLLQQTGGYVLLLSR